MSVSLFPVTGLPNVKEGDNLAQLIIEALKQNKQVLEDGDILVVAQKIVSKAEARQIDLNDIDPSPRAVQLAEETSKDPRLVELTLQESKNVIRAKKGVLIVESNLGLIHANAGIDQSNVEGSDQALLLPLDPDASANRLKNAIDKASQVSIGVVINDSVGRAWRKGTVGLAIGTAGMCPVQDLKGQTDLMGRPLETTEVGLADQIASAASLVQGQAGEGIPVVLLRGLEAQGNGTAKDILRPSSEDLFR